MNEKFANSDFATCTVAYNDEKLIGGMLEGVKDLHNLVIISEPWRGVHTEFDKTGEISKRMGAEVVCQNFKCQKDERNFGMDYLEKKGYKYIFIIDTDEYYLKENVQKMIDFINEYPRDVYSSGTNDNVFWKSWKYHFIHGGAISCLKANIRFSSKRECNIKPTRFFNNISMYHFAFNRSKEEMLRKVETREYCVMSTSWLEKYWTHWKFGENYENFKIVLSKNIPEEILGRYIKSKNLLY